MQALSPFPNITTERLLLRQLEWEDYVEIFSIRNHPIVNRFVNRPPTMSVKVAQDFTLELIQSAALYWAITLKGQPKLFGTICLWNISQEKACADVGYEMLPHMQGNGYMTEALAAVIDFGFQKMGLAAIEAYTNIHNHPSINLLEKFSFKKIGEFKNDNGTLDAILRLNKEPQQSE